MLVEQGNGQPSDQKIEDQVRKMIAEEEQQKVFTEMSRVTRATLIDSLTKSGDLADMFSEASEPYIKFGQPIDKNKVNEIVNSRINQIVEMRTVEQIEKGNADPADAPVEDPRPVEPVKIDTDSQSDMDKINARVDALDTTEMNKEQARLNIVRRDELYDKFRSNRSQWTAEDEMEMAALVKYFDDLFGD